MAAATGYFDALKAAEDAAKTQQAASYWQNKDETLGLYKQTSGGSGSQDPDSPSAVQAQADKAAKERLQSQLDADAAARATQETNRQNNAIQVVQALLKQYNLSSLYNTVVDYVKNGYDPESISVLIRTTPEYQQRFPAMAALSAKGRAISEADYINFEQQASGLERRYGLPEGMLMGNVTELLTNEVSATELNDRVVLASAASIQAPQEVKDMFKNYYGIDSGGMTAYFLDPDKATPLLEKQFASSLIGNEAARQGIGIDVYSAENLQSLGVTKDEARTGFATVAGAQGLTAGRGDTVTQQQLISGTLGKDEKAKKDIERAAGSRVGRFQGGGEFLQNQQGNVGLGSAATR